MFKDRTMTTDNTVDGSVIGMLSLGWVMQLDWVFLSGLAIGLATVVIRYLEYRQRKIHDAEMKRANDLKQRELDGD
jgi:membrane protein implicated in regulation of membrane protease activity